MSSNANDSPSATETESQNGASASPGRARLQPEFVAPKKKLPPFLDHFNARDLKILFRCSVAFWVTGLLIVIEPTLKTFGTATFFGCIVVLFLPPSGVLLVSVLGASTMLLGMALAWAWGVIAMKAALATRSQSETLAREALLAQKATTTAGSGPYPAATVLIYNGFMLDARITITYFCMLGLFVYLMARLRVRVPKLALTSVFAWIITDVFLTYGPLLPSFNGTLPTILIEPAAAALAISFACSVLIFPESTSHMTLVGMHKLVTGMAGSLDITTGFLASHSEIAYLEQMRGFRAGLIGGWAALEPSMAFLSFDISVGHWNAQDIASLRGPIRQVLLSTLSLLDFEILQNDSREKVKQLDPSDSSSEDTKHDDTNESHTYGKHQIMQSLNLLEALRHPDVDRSVTGTYHVLSRTADPLIQASKGAFAALIQSIHENNSRRWFGRMSAENHSKMRQGHVDALEKLQEEKARFPKVANKALLAVHRHHFDESGKLVVENPSRHKLVGLFLGFNIEDRLILQASALETALNQITLLETERTKVRVWLPTSFRKFGSWVFGKTGSPILATSTAEMLPDVDEDAIHELQQNLRPTHKPLRRRNRISTAILGVGHWLSNDEGLFALRVLIATIAAAVPAACKSSAGFYYREKGLWALIMAQTGMAVYSAEFNFAFVTRIFGTVSGGVLGMLGWYIGSGNGPGNPYGLGAVLALYSVILMWFRLYTPPAFLATVMTGGATTILVIGYSYIDTHNPSYGNPGVGYEVFWRRTLLVLVGFGITFIVSLLPKPSSQSRFVAGALSNALRDETDQYAVLLSTWHDAERDQKFVPAVVSVAIQLTEKLSALAGPIGSLKFEFSSSAFDSKTCGRIQKSVEYINYSLAHLYIRSSRLPVHLRERFAIASGLLDHRNIADVMSVMGLLSQAIKTGDPLPARLPTPLLKRCLEKGHNGDVDTLTLEMLREESYRGFYVCVSAYIGFLSGVDELVLVLKEALGEAHWVPEDLGLDA